MILCVLLRHRQDKCISGEPQGNGKECMMSDALREKMNKFYILNHGTMDKWQQLCKQEWHGIEKKRSKFRA